MRTEADGTIVIVFSNFLKFTRTLKLIIFFIQAGKSVEHPDAPPTFGIHRGTAHTSGYIIEPMVHSIYFTIQLKKN